MPTMTAARTTCAASEKTLDPGAFSRSGRSIVPVIRSNMNPPRDLFVDAAVRKGNGCATGEVAGKCPMVGVNGCWAETERFWSGGFFADHGFFLDEPLVC